MDDQFVAISILTVGEIYKNSFPEEEASNRHFFKWHNQVPINFAIAKHYPMKDIKVINPLR
ncbi:MAG: hypothetical protein UY06_C0034G0009 [Candidatus Amesbacteria bacterium GW2011_GWA2_47_70]|nr:MAG: hypothetical protein UY06_C0034G0009 [Candidatus Amesbacteria bacterium GW2011_GWA2_47_70]